MKTLASMGCAFALTLAAQAAAADVNTALTISATTGKVGGSERRFKKGDVVDVCLVDQNPFRYSYTLESKAEAIPQVKLEELLKGAFLSPVTPEPVTAKPEAPTAPQNAAKAPDPADAKLAAQCQASWAPIEARSMSLEAAQATVRSRLDDLKAAHEAAEKGYEKQRQVLLSTPQPSEVDLTEAAGLALDALRLATPPTELVKPIEALREGALAQIARLEAFGVAAQTCPAPVPAAWQARLRQAVTWSTTFASQAERSASEYDAHAKKLASQAEAIERILGSPTAFRQCRTVGGYETPTNVSVKAGRKPLDGKGEQEEVAAFQLNFGGGARFVLAAGPVVATRLGLTEYGRIPSTKPDPDDSKATVTISRVGVKETSKHRTLMMALLHGRVTDFTMGQLDGSLFISAGTTTSAELFAGASLGLVENQVFLSVGALRARQDQLAGGFAVDQEIPTSFTADIPIQGTWRWGLAFGLTIKVK